MIAIVKPLFKKGEKNCFNNYRPISPLPTISNKFERAIYFHLYDYLNIKKQFIGRTTVWF